MRLSVLLVLAFITTTVVAQGRKEKALYLRSGDVVFGRILTHDSTGNCTLENRCGITRIAATEIDHIVNRNTLYAGEKSNSYYNQSTVALLFGEGSDGFQPKVSLTMVNGWQWNRQIFTGLGLGFEHYDRGVVPLFAEFKYFLSTAPFSPFVSARIGYAFPAEKLQQNDFYTSIDKTYGGILLNPEAGVRFATRSNGYFIASIGYNYQSLSYHENYMYWTGYDRTVFTDFNRISLRLGFIFL